MSQATITRAARQDANGEAVVAYYRDATTKLVYRYADALEGHVWLYSDTDRPLGRYATVADLEASLSEVL